MRSRSPIVVARASLGALFSACTCLVAFSCGEGSPATCDAPPTAGPVYFEDRTAALGVTFTHHRQTELCHITDTIGGPGVCAFDFDADGDVDLYFPDREGHPSALYRNDGERFVDVASEVGVATPGDAVGCLALDADGDEDLDLFVTAVGTDRLYRNAGGTFVDVTEAAGIAEEQGFSTSATAADIDADGDLDLFVGRLVDLATCPDACNLFPLNCEPEESLLYVNDGEGRFTEEARARGVGTPETTLAAVFFDEDGDGDADLYVGNDMGVLYADRLYVNDGTGHFTDEASNRGYSAAGTDTMGVDVGDLDGDGVTEMVTTDFRERPTRLYNCRGDGLPCSFESLPPESTDWVNWGIGMLDVDADGDLDVFQASGDVYDTMTEGSPNQLFLNDGTGRLGYVVPAPGDGLLALGYHRGVAFADLDGDLDPDVVVATNGGSPRVLYDVATRGHSVLVKLPARSAGARVTVTAGGRSLTEHSLLGGSYLSSSDPRLHFGIGESCEATVRVQYLGGGEDSAEVRAGETVSFD